MTWTMAELAEKMRGLDFAMFTTHGDDGRLRSRPMSNNGDVEFDGDSWFFSNGDTNKVGDIGRDPHVQL